MGYIEHDNPRRNPTSILPLKIISKEGWNRHLPLLEKEYNAWKFRRASHAGPLNNCLRFAAGYLSQIAVSGT